MLQADSIVEALADQVARETYVPDSHLDFHEYKQQLKLKFQKELEMKEEEEKISSALDILTTYLGHDILDALDPEKIQDFALEKFHKKEYKSAEEIFFLLTILRPTDPVYYIRLGVCYQCLQEPHKALDCFNKALELNKKDSLPYLLMTESFLSMDDKVHARESFEKGHQLADDKWRPYFESLKGDLKG